MCRHLSSERLGREQVLQTVFDSPDRALPYYESNALARAGAEAGRHLRLLPAPARGEHAHSNLGVVLMARGEYAAAEHHYKRATTPPPLYVGHNHTTGAG